MKKALLILIQILFAYTAYSQTLKFDPPSSFSIKEEKQDKTISISFTLEKATRDHNIKIEVDDENSSATKGKDYSLSINDSVKLTIDNKYSSKLELVIKADAFTENMEEIHLKFKYKDESSKEKEIEYVIFINDINDGSEDEPQYTNIEKNKLRNLSIDVFTGGNSDFFHGLKFNKVGGELVVTANNITGKKGRLGGFLGIGTFQNFTFDSSNRHVRAEHIRIDTGKYNNGVTRYIEKTFVDHRKQTTNQWSYYVNPTYRLNKNKSDLFNIYISLRLETLRISTKSEFKTDTLSIDTTSRALGPSPIFQSGKGFLLQKVEDVETNGFFSIGFPMFLNAKDKFKLYFDPNFGVSSYTYSTYELSANRASRDRVSHTIGKAFYLFRLRVTEQFSGINITIGGEIRGLLPAYTPTINAYLGIRADIVKWFSKEKPKS